MCPITKEVCFNGCKWFVKLFEDKEGACYGCVLQKIMLSLMSIADNTSALDSIADDMQSVNINTTGL